MVATKELVQRVFGLVSQNGSQDAVDPWIIRRCTQRYAEASTIDEVIDDLEHRLGYATSYSHHSRLDDVELADLRPPVVPIPAERRFRLGAEA